jgi:crotonobetainyl-CoA:carnitine CoA-transferase CaiB-like acyl-CoA transferase
VSGPLDGLRVVEVGTLATAYGCRLLAALGAEVVCAEPEGGNPLRHLPPSLDTVEAPENGLWWAAFAAGKRSVVVRSPEEMQALLEGADAVVEDTHLHRRSVFGFDAAEIRDRYPDLVWVAVTPFGLTGPLARWRGSDLTAWAGSSVLYQTGFPERPPVVPAGPVQLAMHTASLQAANGLLLARRAKARHGRGQVVDVAVREAVLALSPECGVPLFLDDQVHRARAGNRRPVVRPWGIYPCADGYVAFLVLQPAHWSAFAQWLADELGNDAALDPVFLEMTVRAETMDLVDVWTEELTATRTKRELVTEGQRRSIPITPVNTLPDLMADPHLEAVGFWDTMDHPTLGEVRRPGAPFRDDRGWWDGGRSPLLGEHQDLLRVSA